MATTHRVTNLLLVLGASIGAAAVISTIWFATWIAAHPPLPGLFSDSINYLQIAEYFKAAWAGTLVDAHREQFAGTRFPPLYPLVLAMAGAGLQQWDAAVHLAAMLVTGYIALALLFLRQQTGSAIVALVLVPVAVLTPQLVEWLLLPLSEPLYAIIVLAALLAANAKASPVLATATLVSLAPLCRSAGLALVLAYVAWLLTDRNITPARRAVAAVIAVLPAAAWTWFRSTQPVLGGYGESLSIEATIHAAGGLGAFVSQQVAATAAGASAWLDPATPIIAQAGALVLAVPAIAGLLLRVRERKLDAWYLLAYLGVVAVWPYPVEAPRLLSVAAPLLMLAAWTGTRHAFERYGTEVLRVNAQGLAAVALTAIALTASFTGYQRLFDRTTMAVPEAFEPARRWTLFLNTPDPVAAYDWAETLVRTAYLVDDAVAVVPAGACVHTNLRAFVDMRSAGALRTVETPLALTADTAVGAMAACDWVLVTQLGSPQRKQPPLYPLDLLGARASVVLASEGERGEHGVLFAALVRIEREQAPAP